MINFGDQEVKGQGHRRPKYVRLMTTIFCIDFAANCHNQSTRQGGETVNWGETVNGVFIIDSFSRIVLLGLRSYKVINVVTLLPVA